MVHLYAVPIDEVFGDIEPLMCKVSEERQARIERFVFQADKVRCLFAEVLLRYGLKKDYWLTDNEIQFGYGQYGKPFLKGREDIFFNLSHSGQWVFCGIGDVPIGVDVEKIKEKNNHIAQRFFTDAEYNYIQQQPEDARKDAFYRLWTLKESYVKAVGKGLQINLCDFSIEIGQEEIQLMIDSQTQNSFQFISEKLDQEHCGAVCFIADGPELNTSTIHKLDIQELINLS